MISFTLVASLALDGVAIVLLALVTWRAVTKRDRPNATAFAAISGGLLLWAVLSFVSEFPDSWPVSGGLAGVAQILPIVFIPALWLVYVLGYTGRGTDLTPVRIGMFVLLALPLVGSAVVIALGGSLETVERSLASLIGTELLLLFIVYVYAAVLFLRYTWNHDRVSKTQLGAQLGAISAPYVVGLWIDGNQIVDGVTGGLLLSGLLLGVSLRRYPVLIGFPKADYVARSRVFEELQEAVFVVDWDGHILDTNSTAENLFDSSTQRMIGTSIRSVVEGMSGADLSTGTTGTVTLRTSKGRRRFQYTVSAVGAEGGDRDSPPVARTILLRDITDERTREQRLSVLNRVLRHNVQNKLDVILAHSDRIEDDTHRTAIQESADDLLSISQKARDAEAVMTDTVGSPSRIDLVTVVRTVARNTRDEHPETEISVSAPERLQLVSHRTIVQRLAAELVENAIVHSAAPGRVEIEVDTATDGTPRLRVGDNGPGIPDRERDLLTGTGETQHRHGLGVGLWFVNWAVSQLGAELEFERANSEGTVVVVEFHGYERQDEPERSIDA